MIKLLKKIMGRTTQDNGFITCVYTEDGSRVVLHDSLTREPLYGEEDEFISNDFSNEIDNGVIFDRDEVSWVFQNDIFEPAFDDQSRIWLNPYNLVVNSALRWPVTGAFHMDGSATLESSHDFELFGDTLGTSSGFSNFSSF